MVVLSWIDALLDWAKLLSYEWYLYIKWITGQLLYVIFSILALLWLSVFLYGGFYYTYMPSVVHTRDVHLQFGSDCELDQRLCTFPSANVTLSKNRRTDIPILMRGQPYVILFRMEMPESPVNQQLGMFMVNLTLYTNTGETIQTSARSAMLKYKSSLFQTLETWAFLPNLLFGYKDQKQDVEVELFDRFLEDPYKSTAGFYVEVRSKRIEIYSSSIVVHAKFSGLRYLLFTYPITSALFGVGTNMFFLVIMFMLSWQRFNPKDKSPALPSRFVSLEERKARVKARLERERLAQESRDQTTVADVGSSSQTSLAGSDSSGGCSTLVTEAVTEAVRGTEGREDPEQADGFEEVFHTSEDPSDVSLSEGIRHRANLTSS